MRRGTLVGLHGYQSNPQATQSFRANEAGFTTRVALNGFQMAPTLGGWGMFDFLRPSRVKKWAPVVGATAAAIPGPWSPITVPVGATLVAAGAASGIAHESYRSRGGNAYTPEPGIQPQPQPQAQSQIPWVPIALGGVAAFIALKD